MFRRQYFGISCKCVNRPCEKVNILKEEPRKEGTPNTNPMADIKIQIRFKRMYLEDMVLLELSVSYCQESS